MSKGSVTVAALTTNVIFANCCVILGPTSRLLIVKSLVGVLQLIVKDCFESWELGAAPAWRAGS
eukprot:scaffold24155_cov139-Skeletonema_dohrnii-CCMP3373.AAC.3